MQLSLRITSDKISLQHTARRFEEDAGKLPAKRHLPSAKVNVLGHPAAGTHLASISLSNSLHKCLLMGKFKLKIFKQESFSVPVVWALAYKGRNYGHYQKTITYYSAILNTLLFTNLKEQLHIICL